MKNYQQAITSSFSLQLWNPTFKKVKPKISCMIQSLPNLCNFWVKQNMHLLQSGTCIFAITEHAVVRKSICISHTGGLNCRRAATCQNTMEFFGFLKMKICFALVTMGILPESSNFHFDWMVLSKGLGDSNITFLLFNRIRCSLSSKAVTLQSKQPKFWDSKQLSWVKAVGTGASWSTVYSGVACSVSNAWMTMLSEQATTESTQRKLLFPLSMGTLPRLTQAHSKQNLWEAWDKLTTKAYRQYGSPAL